jgi:hypothetical protein
MKNYKLSSLRTAHPAASPFAKAQLLKPPLSAFLLHNSAICLVCAGRKPKLYTLSDDDFILQMMQDPP